MPSDDSTAFWKSFHKVVPDSVTCTFYSTAAQMANGRAVEYRRESGPFFPAVRDNHLYRAILRVKDLKRLAQALIAFCGEDDAAITNAAAPIEEILTIIALFETSIVNPLDEAMRRGDEQYAEEVINQLKESVPRLAILAEERFLAEAEKLESRVVKSVVAHAPMTAAFVSVVSLDLAQYGSHAKVVHNYADAVGVFSLNRRIEKDILEALKETGLVSSQLFTINSGDGALLILPAISNSNPEASCANTAYKFCEAFLTAVGEANLSVDLANQLHFRIGISSGRVALESSRIRQTDLLLCRTGGMPIGSAVRLQSAAKTGEIILCSTTYKHLDPRIQSSFGPETEVFGKVHEKIPIKAHRKQCIPQSQVEVASTGN